MRATKPLKNCTKKKDAVLPSQAPSRGHPPQPVARRFPMPRRHCMETLPRRPVGWSPGRWCVPSQRLDGQIADLRPGSEEFHAERSLDGHNSITQHMERFPWHLVLFTVPAGLGRGLGDHRWGLGEKGWGYSRGVKHVCLAD